jgi:hypothetical protein
LIDIEACAIRLDFSDVHLYILGVYRAPVGNFKQFLIQLEKILRKIYNTKCDYIICGDFKINYLQNYSNRYKLDTLLMSYNLTSIVDFPTRIDKEASSTMDSIFIGKSKFDNYTIMPSINGLLDHDAQLLAITITHKKVQKKSCYYKRRINSHTVADFQHKLSYKNWDSIFRGEDIKRLFNNFHNIYARIFDSSFLLTPVNKKVHPNTWITKGIHTSCHHKRILYLESGNSDNPTATKFYKDYCKILNRLIKEAKRLHYNKLISHSKNRTKQI